MRSLAYTVDRCRNACHNAHRAQVSTTATLYSPAVLAILRERVDSVEALHS